MRTKKATIARSGLKSVGNEKLSPLSSASFDAFALALANIKRLTTADAVIGRINEVIAELNGWETTDLSALRSPVVADPLKFELGGLLKLLLTLCNHEERSFEAALQELEPMELGNAYTGSRSQPITVGEAKRWMKDFENSATNVR